jgi:hypothetical protein
MPQKGKLNRKLLESERLCLTSASASHFICYSFTLLPFCRALVPVLSLQFETLYLSRRKYRDWLTVLFIRQHDGHLTCQWGRWMSLELGQVKLYACGKSKASQNKELSSSFLLVMYQDTEISFIYSCINLLIDLFIGLTQTHSGHLPHLHSSNQNIRTRYTNCQWYFPYTATSNSVLRDAVHRLYQGILCLQNVTGFHGKE